MGLMMQSESVKIQARPKPESFMERNKAHLERIKESKFEIDLMKNLEQQRVLEAKKRFRNWMVNSDMNDQRELRRIINYYAHRHATLITLLKDCSRARKSSKTNNRPLQLAELVQDKH